MKAIRPRLLSAAAAALLALFAASPAGAVRFVVTNLASDGSVPAANPPDTSLKNPWGVAYTPSGPFWVSDNGTGVSTLYNGAGVKQGLTVTLPGPGAAPTGMVFNSTASGFQLNGAKPLFLFDGEDGKISGWAPSFGTSAVAAPITTSADAVFKGLALGGDQLYATDFHGGDVDVFNSDFSVHMAFTDATVADGFAPFNAQVLDGELYVTFAKQDADRHDDVGGAGNGYVDVFNLDGSMNRRLVSLGGQVNSPWGLAIAPTSFGDLAGDLLVGNFGDGTISAFDRVTGAFDGKLLGLDNKPIALGDLWALTPGNDGRAGSSQSIYFTSGVEDESGGLFGSLSVAPEPQTWLILVVGLGLAGGRLRRRTRQAA